MGILLEPNDLIKLLLALLAGGVVGIEREFRDKAAGFRTLIFICLGAALFTILSMRLPGEKDNSRIAAGVVSGIGFLGAGVILRQGFHISGLTTAATIWLTAALGMAIGAGEYILGFVATVLTLVVLEIFPWVELVLNRFRDERKYEVVFKLNYQKSIDLMAVFQQHGLHVTLDRQYKLGDKMACIFETSGTAHNHSSLLKELFDDPEILEIKY